MTDVVLLEMRPQGVFVLTLHRPEVANAFDDKVIDALMQALLQLRKNPAIRALWIKGAGKHFSAGADLNWMRRSKAMSLQENIKDAQKLADLLALLDTFPVPVLAQVQGAVFGGAIGIVTCCDMVIASSDSRLCFSEVKLGLIPAVISPYVVRSMGIKQARRWFISAEILNAEKAKALGLIDEVLAPEEVERYAANWVVGILKNAPQAVCAAKKLIQHVSQQSNGKKEDVVKAIAELRVSAEGQEGISAFLANRKPSWLET